MPNVIMPNVIMPNVIMPNVIMLNVIMLNVIMLNVIMLKVIMLNVIVLGTIPVALLADQFKFLKGSKGCQFSVCLRWMEQMSADCLACLEQTTYVLLTE